MVMDDGLFTREIPAFEMVGSDNEAGKNECGRL